MQPFVELVLDGRIERISLGESSPYGPTTTVLNFLRSRPTRIGTKEGCAEGDCGACTVVVGELEGGAMRYRAIDSCLLLLPMLNGKQLLTVEDLAPAGAEIEDLHPVQRCMVECNGSQCGYCTPGIVMSLFALYKSGARPERARIEDALTGNLCRCTGYRSIVEAAAKSCETPGKDRVAEREPRVRALLLEISSRGESMMFERGGQSYFRPLALEEACRYLAERPSCTVISGATDVALRITKRHEILEDVLDIGAVRELREIRESGASIRFGAGVDLETVLEAARNRNLHALTEMLEVFGSKQIRSMATFGGNLGTASPIGDTLPVLMAYDATILLRSIRGSRSVPMRDFVTGYRQTLRQCDELIEGVEIPLPAPASVRAYKVSKRRDLDISTVSAGFRVDLGPDLTVLDACLAYGGMAARVARADAAEAFLRGKPWTLENVERAMELVASAFTPISDARSGAEARTVASKNLLLKYFEDSSNRRSS